MHSTCTGTSVVSAGTENSTSSTYYGPHLLLYGGYYFFSCTEFRSAPIGKVSPHPTVLSRSQASALGLSRRHVHFQLFPQGLPATSARARNLLFLTNGRNTGIGRVRFLMQVQAVALLLEMTFDLIFLSTLGVLVFDLFTAKDFTLYTGRWPHRSLFCFAQIHVHSLSLDRVGLILDFPLPP